MSHEINCFKHYTPISYQQQGDVREESSSDDHQHQRPGEPEAQSPKVKPEEAQEQRLSQTVCPEPRVPSPEPRAPSIAVFSWPRRMLESHFCSPTKRKGLQRISFVINAGLWFQNIRFIWQDTLLKSTPLSWFLKHKCNWQTIKLQRDGSWTTSNYSYTPSDSLNVL